MQDQVQEFKNVADVTAAGLTGATLLKILPAIAAVFSIIWLSIRIYELTTGREFYQSWLARLVTRRKAEKQ